MTRSEAIDLLQVLLLDERKVPPLRAPGLFGRGRRLAARAVSRKLDELATEKQQPAEAGSHKGSILL